ncbi:hypothetical protein K439DRAFT_1641781 [Ramaria rubella]|nr:hypothetical protein K439DRAFT_1641781 [Ramaria rubella]
MGVPLHRHRFNRPDVLQRHLQDVHKMEKGQAKRTSKGLMLVSRLGSRGWADAIQRILC